MISRLTGEVHFDDALDIGPSPRGATVLAGDLFPVPGWTAHDLGIHLSDHGAFTVIVKTSVRVAVARLST